MASGYFPVTKSDEWGKQLAKTKRLIRDVIDRWYESRGSLSAEDAASDQSYIDDLFKAMDLLGLGVDETDAAELEAAIEEADERQELAGNAGDRWRRALNRIKSSKMLDDVERAGRA